MTVTEAKNIVRNYDRISNPSQEDDFAFTEAMHFLIEETKNPEYMMELGGWYYGRRDFELALKYYEAAAEYKLTSSYVCLGYIWYYGRTGEKDYDKAFKYYSLAAEAGDLESQYKVADMYKNGYAVEKNYEKYKEIIEDLFLRVKDKRNLGAPVPQVFMRLARIRTEEGKKDEAISLYLYAKSFLQQRLYYNSFFGDITNMKWLIESLYELKEFDTADFDFYDMFWLLRSPNKISFRYDKRKYEVESLIEDGECVIRFGGKWFRTREDFFNTAVIGNERLTHLYADLYMFEVK